jgi:protein-tyrosine phosphatase
MRIPLDNALNLKDMGGVLIDLNKITKTHQFLRSDLFLKITDEEVNFLVNYGLKVVIDLREDHHTQVKSPDVLNRKEFTYYSISLVEYNPSIQSAKEGANLIDSYYFIVKEHQKDIKRVFDVILSHPNDTIMFHCFAGKDRTGLIAYFLYSIVGVSFLDILADYVQTEVLISPYVNKMLETKPHFKDTMVFWNSNAKNLIEINKYIINEYGSVLSYLEKVGLTKGDFEAIRRRFIETSKLF